MCSCVNFYISFTASVSNIAFVLPGDSSKTMFGGILRHSIMFQHNVFLSNLCRTLVLWYCT